MTVPHSGSSRNAYKHGLTSHLHLALENADTINAIREDLIRAYNPMTPEEERCVDDLSLALFKVQRNEEIDMERRQEEKLNAALIYDLQLQEEHDHFRKLWQATPSKYLRNMTNNVWGSKEFKEHWSNILALASADKGTITLTQALNSCPMLGSLWQVQSLTSQGRHFMGLYLASIPNPEQVIETWVDRCGSDNRDSDIAIAHEIFALAPDMQTARKQIAELARDQFEEMSRLHDHATRFYETTRHAFAETSCGHGLGDKKRTNAARLFYRYATADQNRADKLEKRLGILKRNRSRHRQADAMPIKYDARYMNLRPEDIYVDPANDCSYAEPAEMQPSPAPEPVQIKPEPVRPKYTFHEIEQMMREALREKFASEVGVMIAAEPASTGEPLPGDENQPEFAHINWHNSRSVTPADARIMEDLSVMDEGPEQETLVKRYFGTQANLMKAYNAYFQVPGCH
jgi:hypothetical protein